MVGEYRESLDVSGPGGGPVQFSHLRKMSDEDLNKLLDELKG